MYDLFMRMPLLSWVTIISMFQIMGFIEYVAASPDPIKICMRLSSIIFLILVGAMVVFRTRPSNKATGLEPRISALAGTFLMYAIGLFPRIELSPAAGVMATFFTMVGSIAAIVALWQLGRSFSLMAESRQLVTTGPYSVVRHPLYVAEEIAMVGLFMQFASVWTALLFAAQITFQLRRMHNEEKVLSTTFPEYERYRLSTARLIPGIY